MLGTCGASSVESYTPVPWCPECGGRVRGGLRVGLDGYRLAPCGHVGFPDWRPEGYDAEVCPGVPRTLVPS